MNDNRRNHCAAATAWRVAFLLLVTPVSVAPHAPGITGTGYSFPADIPVSARTQRRNEYPASKCGTGRLACVALRAPTLRSAHRLDHRLYSLCHNCAILAISSFQGEAQDSWATVPVYPWTCWYEGARIHRLPVPVSDAALRVAEVGQTFSTGIVQETPFGGEWLRISPHGSEGPLWIPLAYCRRVTPENDTCGDLPIGGERIGPYDGLPFDYRPNDLARMSQRYCYNDMPQRLRLEAAKACREMLDAARYEARLRIKILSAYRSARTQAYLCRRKIDAAGLGQDVVARPGHSEHQLGTTVDLVGDKGRHLLDERFARTPEGRWLRANCRRFGFVQSYTRQRASREGVAYEPWHFRYVGRVNVERFAADWDLSE